MSQFNIKSPSTNKGEPDITQCLTEVQIGICSYVYCYVSKTSTTSNKGDVCL